MRRHSVERKKSKKLYELKSHTKKRKMKREKLVEMAEIPGVSASFMRCWKNAQSLG